ncbi:MAG TPA: MurR/RpiR family transcriptional regulator, partial [Bacillota bacterium]|nr:MurR/RpiR family transcriptional regulator [Bacillota bacterium]
MNNGLERIRQGYQSLKPSEQKAASYILNHPERILDMAIAELAKETSVSEATIIRMCRSLYFKGYKDLKLSISASINQLEQSFYQYRDISPDASLPEIIQYVTENNIASIKSTLAILHEEKIQEAIHELDKARKIIV